MRSFILSKILGPKSLDFTETKPNRWEKSSRRFAVVSMWFLVLSLGILAIGTLSQKRAQAEDIRQAQEARCFALTIYWEAERANIIDKVAIAQNILERTVSGEYPANICSTVNEVRKHHLTKADTAMYSYIKDARSDPGLRSNPEWDISERVATEVMADWKANGRNYQYYPDIRKLASFSVNYHAEMKKWPEWAYSDVKSCRFKPLGKIGAHFHYADFRRADPENYTICIAKLKGSLKVAKR